MSESWDVALKRSGGVDGVGVHFPAALAVSLKAAGFNRVIITLTEEGILLAPYSGEKRKRTRSMVDLPQSWSS